jgi:hypothetical protein
MTEKANDIININKQLSAQRQQYKSKWDDVTLYINIARQQMTTPGQKTTTQLYFSHVLVAYGKLQAGLYSYLTSPYLPWVRIKMQDEELDKDTDVKRWLDGDVMPALYKMFSQSRLYSSFSEYYGDIISFGPGCIYVGEGNTTALYVQSVSPYEFNLSFNADGEVDTVFREMSLTCRQLQNMFPEGTVFNDKIMDIMANRSDKMYTEKFPFIHAVMPRENRMYWRKDNKNLPYASYYIDVEAKEIVEESGYHEFPYAVSMWSTNNLGTYGECPGTIVLPDAKTANVRRKNMLTQEEKILNPPLDVPESYKGRIDPNPGGLNFRTSGRDRIQTLDITGKLEYSMEMMKFDMDQIDDIFFVPVFQMLAQIERQMTAYEVSKRESERMLALGPILGNLLRGTNNIVIRAFNIGMRMGLIPPPPPIVQGHEYDIEYISPLARAQKASQGNSLQEALAFIFPLAQAKPEILDNVDADEIFKYVWDLYGCPAHIMTKKDDIAKMRQYRQQMAEQSALLEMGQQQAQIAKDAEQVSPEAAQRIIGL